MIESRAFVEKRIRQTAEQPVSDAEINDLVDKVMLRQQAQDAAKDYMGYHEYICGEGTKKDYFVDGWLAGWTTCKEFLGGMNKTTERDPRIDPQPGDKIFRVTDATGFRRSRQVVARVDNDITYLTQDGKTRTCWISTWIEWGTHADVEK